MQKIRKGLYWASTSFLAIGMFAGGIQQLLQIGGYVEIVGDQLGYPLYMLSIIGTWKILGVLVVLLPKFQLLKEWAYAGFVFVLTGAIASHLAAGQSIVETLPATILLIATVASWYNRPDHRRLESMRAK